MASGAIWDVLIGIELIGTDYELRYDTKISYRMDYLFGGQGALVSAIASSNAAAQAIQQAELLAAELGRKKRSRRVFKDFVIFFRT